MTDTIITIPQVRDDSLVGVLRTLYATLANTSVQRQYHFNLCQIPWVHPLLVLPLSAFIQKSGSTYDLNKLSDVGKYLQMMSFPQGIDALSPLQQYGLGDQSYTPISILRNTSTENQREKLQAQFEQMILQVLQPASGATSAIYYPISELVTNIFDHSNSDAGYIFGQYYPKKNFLDICILDTGRGLAQTYLEEKGLDFSDEVAMQAALQGRSTKPSKERGFGLRTSKDIVCKALGGSFSLISGSFAYITEVQKEHSFSLPNFYWQGVIIAYRIPRPTQLIDITPFLE